MKLIFEEVNHQYEKYSFPYRVSLLKEEDDALSEIYGSGFLPFRNKPGLFYLSRSSRANLEGIGEDKLFSSENRRIINKTKGFSFEIVKINEFKFDLNVKKQCRIWARKMGWSISGDSIEALFSGKFFNYLLIAKKQDEVVGYSIIYKDESLVHWAYVFYETEYKDLVIRMGLEVIEWADEKGLKMVYLGTCYGTSGHYKRNFAGFEFFNGKEWSCDLKELERLNG